jgi:hypothetical protein
MKEKVKRLLEPCLAIGENKKIFFLWFIFTILIGQIGVIINLILRTRGDVSISAKESIFLDSSAGSFYTFSIALLASSLSPIFINFIESNPPKFKSIKIITIVIAFLTIFFAGIFYSSSFDLSDYVNLTKKSISLDGWQLFFLLTSIIISIYAYSILRMEYNYPKYEHLDDTFSEKDDKKVNELQEKSRTVTKDKKGNKL